MLRFFATGGGLMSSDLIGSTSTGSQPATRSHPQGREAGRPVQAPVKYGLAVNLNPAKAWGITVPGTLLSRTDEVIE